MTSNSISRFQHTISLRHLTLKILKRRFQLIIRNKMTKRLLFDIIPGDTLVRVPPGLGDININVSTIRSSMRFANSVHKITFSGPNSLRVTFIVILSVLPCWTLEYLVNVPGRATNRMIQVAVSNFLDVMVSWVLLIIWVHRLVFLRCYGKLVKLFES